MKILGENNFPLKENTAVAIGFFDGVHLGHAALIQDALAQQGLKSALYTFDSKPAVKNHLFTEEEKQGILRHMGVDYYYSRTFGRSFKELSPEAFLAEMVRHLNVKHVAVGYDFRFGKDAAGDAALLETLAPRYGYTLHVVPEIAVDGHKVSSSVIRDMVRTGDMGEAARLLNRFYFIDGIVQAGEQLGNKLGFPTANLTTNKLLPQNGVYATVVQAGDRLYRAASNVGTKPTVKDDGAVNIETFILDFCENIYGKPIRVYFVEKLRGEVRFPDLDTLKAQIARDSANAREKLQDLAVYKPYIMC